MSLKEMVTRKMGTHWLTVRSHSPKILFVAGVVGFGATVVLAARATLQVESILEKHEADMADIEKARAIDPDVYKESNANQDKGIVFARTALRLGKLYGPAVVVGGLSIAALTGSHVILSNRLNGLAAAYAVLDKGFRAYRERVIAELGPEKDAEFRYGAEDHEIIEETETGPVVKTIRRVQDGPSIYARWFDEESPNWGKHPISNAHFIKSQQDWANEMLRAYGYLFLNDVYKMLGLEPTMEGQVVGWHRRNPQGTDDYISFGVLSNDLFMTERFIQGNEPNILLDFNVDGPIYHLLKQSRREKK